MKYRSLMFGPAIAMAMLRGVKASEPITPNLSIHAKGIPKQNKRIILIDKNYFSYTVKDRLRRPFYYFQIIVGKIMKFSFGNNWHSYSQKALTQNHIENARRSFNALFSGIDIKGKTFIDIGFGQGLSLIIASQQGAHVMGIDSDSENLKALERTKEVAGVRENINAHIVSILNDEFVANHLGEFDIVHSWGVLHHTGNMKQAIKNACLLAAPGGYFVCAIYNRHWTSFAWKCIKRLYNYVPRFLQSAMIVCLFPIIFSAKWLLTMKNPLAKERGMDFFHDVVDWVGGYPYEYAGKEDVENEVLPYGFKCIKFLPAKMPTGCNEFVFRKE